MRLYLPAIAVILTVAGGCDNVAWGGIEMRLSAPPEPPPEVLDSAEAEAAPRERIDGPVLLAGYHDGFRATLTVVAEILPVGLEAFPDTSAHEAERLESLTAAGSEWVLFSEGVRVGRLRADSASSAEGFCGQRVNVSGVAELIPAAGGAEQLLALPADVAEARPYGAFVSHAHDYDQRVASLSLASDALPRLGASWPAAGLLASRADVQAFELAGLPGAPVAATFLHRDELAVGSPGAGAYSLFVIGAGSGENYTAAFEWYRSVETEGKGAARYFDHLDWDGDGSEEILLEVYGADRRWYAALARQDGSWVRTYQDACGGSGSPTAR
jgi:hypothetical protein